jgi:hypothetical protein
LEGKRNPGDELSRRLDYVIDYKSPSARLLATSMITTIELYDGLLEGIKTPQAIDVLAADGKSKIVSTPIVNILDFKRIDELEEDLSNEWKVTTRVLTYADGIYVPNNDQL